MLKNKYNWNYMNIENITKLLQDPRARQTIYICIYTSSLFSDVNNYHKW